MNPNLVVNPSFETTGSWTLGGTTANITLQSTDITAQDGTHECKVVQASGNCYLYQDVTVLASTQYTLSAYVNITAWTAGGLFLKADDTSFGTYTTATSSQGITSGWSRISTTFTTGVGVTTIRIVLDSFNNATLTGYWDAIMFNAGLLETYAPATITNTSKFFAFM